jgi:hypothetical protein
MIFSIYFLKFIFNINISISVFYRSAGICENGGKKQG